jgi:spermidine synthase
MGGTIPILTQALSRGTEDSTRVHAFVYGFNTAGAFAGALTAGFFLVPALGLVRVMICMGVINLFAGLVFGLIGLRRGDEIAGAGGRLAEIGGGDAPPEVRDLGSYLAVALIAGFSMMTIQIVLIRIGGLSFGTSQFTFSMVVAVFVLCIALGSFAVSALPRIPAGALVFNQWALVFLLCFLDPLLEKAPYGAHVLRTLFHGDDTFRSYYLAALLGVLCAIGPPVLLAGATLPLLFNHLRRRVVELGAIAGRIYAWNTLGSLVGALLGGYALLFWLDLDQVYRLAVAALAAGGAILVVRIYRVSWAVAIAVLLAPALGALALRPAWQPGLLMSGLFREREALPHTYAGPEAFFENRKPVEFVFHEDDPIATIGVGEHREGDFLVSRSIVSNGKSDGNTAADYPTMGLAATIPALLADRMERAFVIGFGTGVTAGELASFESTRAVVVAEISPGVVEAAPYFDFANMNASTNPRVRILRSDAYRALLDSREPFDVIVSEPSNPWVTGVEMLFSREFLAAARSRLRPGGVHCQWLQLYETDETAVRLVLRTYAAVFEDVAVWYGRGSDLLLLGFKDGPAEIDLERLRSRFARRDLRASLRRSGVESFPALLAHELVPAGVVGELAQGGPVHTLTHPRLGYIAARAFFRGKQARVPFTGSGKAARVGRENSLWRRHLATLGKREADEAYEQFTATVCANRNPECVAALADWQGSSPESVRRERAYENLGQSVFTFGGRLDRDEVRRYFEAFVRSSGGEVTPEEARRSALLFRRHHFHAASPSPDALVDLWTRCRALDARADGCAKGLAKARHMADAEPERARGRIE